MNDALGAMVVRHYATRSEVDRYSGAAKAGLLAWEDAVAARDFGQQDWDTLWICVASKRQNP